MSVYEELARLRRAMQEERCTAAPGGGSRCGGRCRRRPFWTGAWTSTRRDFWLLRHTLWNHAEDIPVLERLLEDTSGR